MQIKRFFKQQFEAILLWAGEEPLQIAYDNRTIVVPPRHETAIPGRNSIYRHKSVEIKERHYAPGTILVTDEFVEVPGGGSQKTFDCQAMVAYLLRERDDLANRGLVILESKDQIDEAMKMAIPLYEASQDDRARSYISAEMARQKGYADRGEPCPPSTSEHNIRWAVNHLRNRQQPKAAFSPNELKAALEGTMPPTAPTPAAAPAPASAPPAAAGDGASLYAEAKGLGIELTKRELQSILDGDEEMMGFIREKIALRRAG